MTDLFVTGITGLVGRAVAAELDARDASARALVRAPAVSPGRADPRAPGPAIEPVPGDLERPDGLDSLLAGSRTVLHLAAATGPADPERQRRVNVDGTRNLLAACARAGVPRFIYVSSIAATFDRLDRYPYGASKREAERLVAESGLDYAIVRPTVVLGPGSPILNRFRQLAALPLPVLPGRGAARIQPIAAWDLARCLLDLASEAELGGRAIEIGGGEVVTLAEFLGRVRQALGRRAGTPIRIPIEPLRAALAVVGALTRGKAPVSAAQLAMFEQDGVAAEHPFVAARASAFSGLDEMLARSLGRSDEGRASEPGG